VLISGGTVTPIGWLPGDNGSVATSISASAAIAGTSQGNSHPGGHAVLYSAGVLTDLGTLATSGSACDSSTANGINDNGVVVGDSGIDNPSLDCALNRHAFMATNGVMTDLGVLPGDTGSTAASVNLAGQAVGTSQLYDALGNHNKAVLFANGTVTNISPPATTESGATAINDAGQVAIDGDTHLFIYAISSGTWQDAGAMSGASLTFPVSINGLGDVVGTAIGNVSSTPFFWSPKAGFVDLNSFVSKNSGWVLQDAAGINDSGQVVGDGMLKGQPHAFVLTLPGRLLK
jgi:probable HAF family extracellular repeat protein